MSTSAISPELEAAFRRAGRAAQRPTLVDERRPWVWPLPELNGRAPTTFDPILAAAFEPEATEDLPRVLLAYDRKHYTDRASAFLSFTHGATLFHFLPSYTPVFAVQDGEIAAAETTGDGFVVAVEHRDGWTSCYWNLERIFCSRRKMSAASPKERVRAGDVIGYVGGSSLEFGLMKPLRFGLCRRVAGDDRGLEAVDPRARMDTWLLLPHTDHRLPKVVPTTNTVQLAA
jgi:murein DD-endopeptidase MepM/ murein hydrolase activator NlpD